MDANPGRVGATVVGIVIVVVVFLVFLRPNSKSSSYHAPAAGHAVPGEQKFTGAGNRSLGQIRVPVASEAEFSCPACDGDGFAVTSINPANPTDALNDASPSSPTAQFAVSAGTYSDVRVKTGHNAWTLTLLPSSG